MATKPITHGPSGYGRGCKCEICLAGHAWYQRESKREKKLLGLLPDDPRHGKPSTYQNYSCRCDACKAAWAKHHSERRHQARYKYGVSEADLRGIWIRQNRSCGICAEPISWDDTRGFNVDHDHRCCPSGTKGCGSCVRGILCQSCNLGLGFFRDDPDRLESAIFYLLSSGEPGTL